LQKVACNRVALLTTSDLTLEHIAEMSGYHSASHLSGTSNVLTAKVRARCAKAAASGKLETKGRVMVFDAVRFDEIFRREIARED